MNPLQTTSSVTSSASDNNDETRDCLGCLKRFAQFTRKRVGIKQLKTYLQHYLQRGYFEIVGQDLNILLPSPLRERDIVLPSHLRERDVLLLSDTTEPISIDSKLLTKEEFTMISQIINNLETSIFGCYDAINSILKKLPEIVSSKLIVALATNEGNGIIDYHGQSFGFHIFLLGNYKGKLRVFDPSFKNNKITTSSEWMSDVLSSETLELFINKWSHGENHLLNNILPVFRLVDAALYLEYVRDHAKEFYDLTHPERSIRNNSTILRYKIWKNSTFINFYETYLLFSGNATFDDMIFFSQRRNCFPGHRINKIEVLNLVKAFNLNVADT